MDPIQPGSSEQAVREPAWPWLVAAAVGGSCGILHLVRTHILMSVPSDVAEVGFAIGQLGLYAAPLFLGTLAGLTRRKHPVRAAFGLSAVSIALAAPLMGEGLICLIFIAPVHLVVAPVAALIASVVARNRRARLPRLAGIETLLLLVPLGGALWQHGSPPPPAATEVISDSVTFDATPEEVWSSIDKLHLKLDGPVPWYVRAGLPVPTAIIGGGTAVGDERRVVFSNGVVLARVTEARPGVGFKVAISVEQSGREFFDHWVVLEESTFAFEPLPGGRTRLTHATSYRPLAYPRWYFSPVEHSLGRILQRELLESYAAQFPVVPLVASR